MSKSVRNDYGRFFSLKLQCCPRKEPSMNASSPLNILCLVPYNFLPAKMGGQKGIAAFNGFYAKAARIICVTIRNNDPAAADYEVLNILSNSPLRYINPFYFFTLRRIIRQRKITHIQIEHPYYGWLGRLLQVLCGVQLIVHSHNIEYQRFRSLGKSWWRLLAVYERWVHRCADYNLFISGEDKAHALQQFQLEPQKCIVATYGIEWSVAPVEQERKTARQILEQRHGIVQGQSLLLFNGSFGYKPNLDALKLILEQINPLLAAADEFRYKILICGKGIPEELLSGSYSNVIFAGFVDDISVYFKGADVFLNPVADGGGIKTKLVEALGYDLTAVSYGNGAIGIPAAVAGDKLLISKDDPADFAVWVQKAACGPAHIPPAYFEHFYWGNIIAKVIRLLQR